MLSVITTALLVCTSISKKINQSLATHSVNVNDPLRIYNFNIIQLASLVVVFKMLTILIIHIFLHRFFMNNLRNFYRAII